MAKDAKDYRQKVAGTVSLTLVASTDQKLNP
jgi:hypothetical protein